MRLTYAPNLFPRDQMAGCAPCAAAMRGEPNDAEQIDEELGMKADLIGLGIAVGVVGLFAYLAMRG